MNKLSLAACAASITLAGAYFWLDSQGMDLSPSLGNGGISNAEASTTKVDRIQEPQITSVSQRPPVVVDHGAMNLYVDKLKDLYDVNYFKLIKENREAQLYADQARSMRALRTSGYRTNENGQLVYDEMLGAELASGPNVMNGFPMPLAIVDPKEEARRLAKIVALEVEEKELLESLKLVMLDNGKATLRVAGQIAEMRPGDNFNGVQLSSINASSESVSVKLTSFSTKQNLFIQTVPSMEKIALSVTGESESRNDSSK